MVSHRLELQGQNMNDELYELDGCGQPCPPNNACDECAEYWQRMKEEGFWDAKKNCWTEKGIREMCKQFSTGLFRKESIMTITQLLAMPVESRIGGGFILTVKTTKKYVQLPNKKYVHTVVLFDKTGEMVADFLSGTYNPLIKGEQIKIIVAEIQALVLKDGASGIKLYVSQFERLTQTLDEYEREQNEYALVWDKQTRGKIRHGLVCSYIRTGAEIDKERIEQLVEYIMTGE